MNLLDEFHPMPKIARFSREVIVAEKVDGINAQICINEEGNIRAGIRNGWVVPQIGVMATGGYDYRDLNNLTPELSLANWAWINQVELKKLGKGRHFGEWWGYNIGRGYGLTERRFSLFNTERWSDDDVRPKCCHVVPVIWRGLLDSYVFSELDGYVTGIEKSIDLLKENGSYAAPGFMSPEGIVIFHTAANVLFKMTIENDEAPKSTL